MSFYSHSTSLFHDRLLYDVFLFFPQFLICYYAPLCLLPHLSPCCILAIILLQLIVCGQALSHCVQYTVRDILKHWTKDKRQIYLLVDGKETVSHQYFYSVNSDIPTCDFYSHRLSHELWPTASHRIRLCSVPC